LTICRTSEFQLVDVLRAIDPSIHQTSGWTTPDVEADVDALVDAFRLQFVRRYFHQSYWSDESEASARSDIIEPGLKLENVAAHSWHVADAVLLLADSFEALSADKALRLAILHDKLEMYTGDFDPVGGGKGSDTHAFNEALRSKKIDLERDALAEYLTGLRPSARKKQRALIEENLEGVSREARFVRAVDKLQALAFVHEKKRGNVSDAHLSFSLRYSLLAIGFFPEILRHYLCLSNRFLQRIADRRRTTLQIFLAHVAGILDRGDLKEADDGD
jgi:5'-deoxynucleotidase YfbR-like HD superfamily hydrolase